MKKVLLATLFSAFAMSSMAADLHPTCEEFLKEFGANLPAEAKPHLDAARAQYAALTKDQQAAACKESLDSLKNGDKGDDKDEGDKKDKE